MNEHKPKLCIYCGKPSDWDDHFHLSRLSLRRCNNIIIVPACKACNNGFR